MNRKTGPYEEFGRRLTRARVAAGHRSAVDAIVALNLVRRTYYSHESGERMPSDEQLSIYAAAFGVTPDHLRYGTGTAKPPQQPPINQVSERLIGKPSQKYGVRHIVILTAKDIKTLNMGRGDLTSMSGATLPVPEVIAAGPDAFAYSLPQTDYSMSAPGRTSIEPGTLLVFDPDCTVEPGDKVLVHLAGFDVPLLRVYKAARRYVPGQGVPVPFVLSAFNTAFDDIRVETAGDVITIARLVYSAHRW